MERILKIWFDGEWLYWRELDTDVSYESFLYPEAEPTDFQRFFLTHSEINIAGLAQRVGINASLFRNYINGFKNPSSETVEKIKKCLHLIGEEYLNPGF